MAPQYLHAYCEPMSARYPSSSIRQFQSSGCSTHAPEQTMAIVVLPCMDLVCGTVFLVNWDHLTRLWLRSETNWRRYYSPVFQRLPPPPPRSSGTLGDAEYKYLRGKLRQERDETFWADRTTLDQHQLCRESTLQNNSRGAEGLSRSD